MMHRLNPMKRFRHWVLAFAISCAGAATSPAVTHLDTGDPSAYTSTPGDNSGWQYEGLFGGFLGTPIAPLYFITAKHIGRAGDVFVFHGETFKVLGGNGYSDPSTDLQIWKVDHPFATYAPVYQPGNTEVGQELRVFGRGTLRGAEIYVDGTLRGWSWGDGDGVERWGRNVVSAIVPSSPNSEWIFLQAAFDSPGLPGEAHLSVGDSGGGLFILQDGLWRLAGINYGVDDVSTAPVAGTAFPAFIFDARGYYADNGDSTFTLITGAANVPTSFYSTQVSARLAWIESVVGATDTLPLETLAAWQTAYFTPDQIADSAVSGVNADPDGDGVSNLLEFAFNLDPTFPEPPVMTAGTGLRGLPLIRLEKFAPSDLRMTVEFVRRTAGSGSELTYTAQFTSDLNAAWQTGGTESVTAINERWERVKVTDSVAVDGTVPARFARVLVSQGRSGTDNPARPRRRNATQSGDDEIIFGDEKPFSVE